MKLLLNTIKHDTTHLTCFVKVFCSIYVCTNIAHSKTQLEYHIYRDFVYQLITQWTWILSVQC